MAERIEKAVERIRSGDTCHPEKYRNDHRVSWPVKHSAHRPKGAAIHLPAQPRASTQSSRWNHGVNSPGRTAENTTPTKEQYRPNARSVMGWQKASIVGLQGSVGP